MTTTNGPINATTWPVHESNEHVYAVKYSPDGAYVAATVSNGILRIVEAEGQLLQRLKPGTPLDDVPAVAVKWFPRIEEGRYSLAVVSSGGALMCWSFNGEQAERTLRLFEEQNQTSACDISLDGAAVATVGSDRNVRIYDIASKTLVSTYSKSVDDEGYSHAAHSNRIFSVRYLSPTLLVTAGWQSPIRLWDLRTGRAERHISGAQCGADGLEPIPGTTAILTASTRMEQQIQVFDFISGREMEEDSKKLSASLGRLPISLVRLGPAAKRLWFSSAQGGIVGAVNFATGEAVGHATCPSGVMGLEAHTAIPTRALACGMRDTTVQLNLT